MALLLCPSCARHVRATETTCPFCARVLTRDGGDAASRPLLGSALTRGVTRAALVFASAATVAAGCGGETEPGASSSGTSSSGAGGSSGAGSSTSGAPVPMYGPAPVDAGVHDAADLDAAGNPDAKDSGFAVLYGPAPVDGG